MRWVVLDLGSATTGLPDFLALVHQLPDFFAVMKKMRLVGRVSFTASPEREAERWVVHTANVVAVIKHVTDGQIRILIHVIDEVVYIVRTRFIGMHLRHFELAGEECYVATQQFISHFDCEINRARISEAFVFAQSIAATTLIGLPPTAFLSFLRSAIKLHPRPDAGNSEFGIELAATGNWSINAQLQP